MESGKVSHYRILEKLGAGGMGEVYLAEDMKLGRKVAIKILSEEYTTNKDRLHRFEQEASAASNLNHPNILTIHEVGADDGRHFIATEFIDGVTLRRKAADSHLETLEILDIAVQVASALEEAHAAGIVHRDIKPDNIMVRRNGYVKVLDFGLAKLTESADRSPSDAEAATRVMVQTDADVVMGTSHYMSPEQTRGKPVDARSDIWSLGVAIRLSPDNSSARDNLVGSFVGLGRIDEAEQAARELQRINPDSLGVHYYNYFFAFLRRDQAAMDREVEWARGKPEEAEFTATLASTATFFGKLKQAEELEKRAFEMFKNQRRTENASQGLMSLATNLVLLGKCRQATDNAKAALTLLRNEMSVGNASMVFAACNDQNQAQSLLAEMLSVYPKNTVVASMVAPLVRAEIERSRGNVDQASQLLDSVHSVRLGIIMGLAINYARGNLYLQQRMGKEAAAEFKEIMDHNALDAFSPAHPLAYLGFGRAAAVSGDTVGARKAYQDFFALWKDADTDLPVLVQARKEYESLR